MLRAIGPTTAGVGMSIASTFAPSLGLSLQQQRIGFVFGVTLIVVGVVLFVQARGRRRPPEAVHTAPAPAPAASGRVYGAAAIRQAISEDLPQPGGEMKSMQLMREMLVEQPEQEKRDLIESEFVAMIDEGEFLRGDEFSGNPQWGDFTAWRNPIAEFVGTVLGATEKQRLLEAGAGHPEVRGHIREVLDWLQARRDRPDTWQARLSGIDGSDLKAAVKTRRNGLPLATQIDEMIREGMELVSELSIPIQPEKLNWVTKIEAGTPSAAWQAKADAFRQGAHELLEQRHPALLADYREGCNYHIQVSPECDGLGDPSADTRSHAEKTLALANYERRSPAREVKVCLEGLARARKAVAASTS